MILSRLQCRRFFTLFDALTLYANERLDVVGEAELRADSARGIDDQAQGKIAFELWQNLGVIDDFIRENPAGFTAGELDCISSWREGLTDTFLIDVFPDGEVRFIAGGVAFEVSGLSKDIPEMIGELPASAHTTLLPFDGRIVYAEYLNVHLVQFGDGMLDLFDEEIGRIYDEGRIVSTADGLVRTAALLRERELARDTEEMLSDLESGRFSGERVHEHDHGHGDSYDFDDDYDDYDDYDEDFDPADYEQHAGALAGLSFDEREEAIRDHMTKSDASIAGHLVDLLLDECEKISLTSSLAELLKAENIHDVRRFGKYLGMDSARSLDGDELISAVVAQVADVESVQVILDDMPEHHIVALRELAERGGRWDVAEGDISSLRELPLWELGFSYVFHEGETFSFVMPDEILAISGQLDWDGAMEKARRYRELVNLVGTVAELRGIAPIGEVVSEYQRCYPEGFSALQEIVRMIIQAVAEEMADYDLLETPSREMYVLHYELFWAYEEVMGLDKDRYVSEPLTRGELGEMLEDLLKQQEGKEPRPVDADMLDAANLIEWKLRQPPAHAFTQYLDAHVPAVADDYYFADKVMEELLDDAKWGLVNQGTQRLFDILDRNGFMCEPDQIQDVLDLWSNLSNGLPIWPNNGWAPSELASMGPGPRLFFNEDGSIMKVGRNDPCPCGSGLKYKKCCGR